MRIYPIKIIEPELTQKIFPIKTLLTAVSLSQVCRCPQINLQLLDRLSSNPQKSPPVKLCHRSGCKILPSDIMSSRLPSQKWFAVGRQPPLRLRTFGPAPDADRTCGYLTRYEFPSSIPASIGISPDGDFAKSRSSKLDKTTQKP